MDIPFTIDQFLQVFRDYNTSIFPFQLILYVLAFIAIYLVIKPSRISSLLIGSILGFFWLWMGVVYHIMFFTVINKAAFVFGSLFILEGLLIFYFTLFRKKLSFTFKPDIYGVTGMIMILFALLIYPLLGYLFGHIYPASPTFGAPCPTTIFTFGILLMSVNRIPWTVFVIPFLWSLLGFSAALQLGIIEDTGLLVAGLVTVIMLLVRNRRIIQTSMIEA